MAKRKKKEEREAVRAEVVEAMKSKTPGEREKRIVLLWTRWEEAKAFLAKVRSEGAIELKRLQVHLKECMETTTAVDDEQASLRKLMSIEVAWQDLEEHKALTRDGTGGARDGLKSAYETLKESVLATNQLGFEFTADGGEGGMEATGSDDDEPAEDLEDEDEEVAPTALHPASAH